MIRKYGIVLIGCGHIGEEHLADIYFRENIRVVGTVDSNIERAELFARRFGAESFDTDYKRYLTDDSVDIIIIATYSSSHLAIFKDCIANGKHVLCEKPMTNVESQLEEFKNVALAAKTKIKIGHILRHNDTYNKVYSMIQEGKLGFPMVFRMSQNHHTMDWQRYKRILEDTPPVVDCGVHYFDIMQWFTGAKITEVSGICQRTEPDLEKNECNYTMTICRLSDGSVGYYEAGWGNTICADNLKEFIGPKGRIRIEYKVNRAAHKEEGDLIEYYEAATKTYHTINVDAEYKPMYRQLMALIEMIEKDIPNDHEINCAYSATKVAMTAAKAEKENKILHINV